MYSVFNPRGEKIADCGIERDAVTLMNSRNRRWNGHYFTYIPPQGDIIDVSDKQLAGWQEVSEKQFDQMFIEVEGQKLATQQQLPQSDQEKFIPDFHD